MERANGNIPGANNRWQAGELGAGESLGLARKSGEDEPP